MSTRTVTKKRKSGDGNMAAVKKVKTSESADKPAPLKSALKKTKRQAEAPKDAVEETTVVQDDASKADLTPDQTAALLAGFSSSDEDDEASETEGGLALSSLPKAPTKGAVQNRLDQALSSQKKKNKTGDAEDPEATPGVIYIGRIPHGFHEPQMRAYFSQFGQISNLKLARNKKTGASQHYAFVEFASAAVADIVAKTMDKYLLFGHILQVRRVPREQVNEGMWAKGKGRKKPAPRNRMEGRMLRRGATREVWGQRVEREEQRRKEKGEKLKEMGYEFEMPGVKGVAEVPVKPKAVEDVEVAETKDGEVEKTVRVEPEAVTAEVKETKKRPASGKTQVKKAVKKVKA